MRTMVIGACMWLVAAVCSAASPFDGTWTDNDPTPTADGAAWPLLYQRAFLQEMGVNWADPNSAGWATRASRISTRIRRAQIHHATAVMANPTATRIAIVSYAGITEELVFRVIISTLQRMYRHLYFRLCDMTDFAGLLNDHAIDFSELRRAADLGGIWPGVATFLQLIAEYVNSYGSQVELPREVAAAVPSPRLRVHLGGKFLRVSKGPAAGLYGSQLLNAGRHADFRALSRLPLLPPLAISAFLAYRLTGNDKGVW